MIKNQFATSFWPFSRRVCVEMQKLAQCYQARKQTETSPFDASVKEDQNRQ